MGVGVSMFNLDNVPSDMPEELLATIMSQISIYNSQKHPCIICGEAREASFAAVNDELTDVTFYSVCSICEKLPNLYNVVDRILEGKNDS